MAAYSDDNDDEDFDGDEVEESGDDASGSDDSGPAADPEALLQGLVDAGGDLGRLASEALAAKHDREAKAAAESALLTEAATLDPANVGEMIDHLNRLRSDPNADEALLLAAETSVEDAKNALRAQVRADRAKANENGLRLLEQHYKAEGLSEESIAAEMAVERERMVGLAAFEGEGDPLNDSPVWQEYQTNAWTRQRAEAALDDIAMESAWDVEAMKAEQDADVQKMREALGVR